MRDIALVAGILIFLGMTLRYPFAGALTWGWLTLMNPHMMLYSFALGWPFNFVVAVLTLGMWLLSSEKHRWPKDALPILMLIMVAWMTFNSFFAPDPDWSWPLWNRTVKIYVFAFLCMAMIHTKVRLHAMVWIMVISLGFYGAKGGIFTIVNGGNYHVFGPDDTIIADNNQLALAIVMILPLSYYLFLHTRNKWIRLGIGATIPLQIATVLGSYSRGGVIALSVMLAIFWARSRRKVVYFLAGAVLVGGVLQIMPPAFYERMDSIKDAQSDESFEGRLISWQVCYDYAVDHFPFGAGFAGTQRPAIYNFYFPDADRHAAHSIYFQVLGEHGFPALALYLLIALLSLRNLRLVTKRCRNHPDMEWARDLATMTEVGLIGFYVGGAALSMAYYDGLLMLQAFSSILRTMTDPLSKPEKAPIFPKRVSGRPPEERSPIPARPG